MKKQPVKVTKFHTDGTRETKTLYPHKDTYMQEVPKRKRSKQLRSKLNMTFFNGAFARMDNQQVAKLKQALIEDCEG